MKTKTTQITIKSILLASVVLLCTKLSFGQNVGISDDGSSFTPVASSILELKSTSKGVLIPRMTYLQREAISSPAQGLMIYQTDDEDEGQGFYYNVSTTSTADWVYITNSNLNERDNHVIVKSVNDFPEPVSGVITLNDNVTYEINGSVNIGTNTITLGTSNVICGVDKSDDKLIYTGSGSMISGSNDDFTIRTVYIYAPTDGSQVFDISGSTNKVQIVDNIFGGCNDLGSFNGGDILVIDRNLIIACSNGFEFKGTLENLFIVENVCESNTGTLINIPSGSFYSIQIQNNYFDIASGHTGLDLDASTANVDDAKVLNNFFRGTGTYITGVTTTYASWFFMGNTELEDSNPYGYLAIIENTNATSIASNNTYYKVTGNNYTSKGELFDTNDVHNRLRYTGEKELKVQVKCSGVFTAASTNKNVWFAVLKNGTTQVCKTRIKPKSTSTDYNFSMMGEIKIEENDYLELFVKTQGATFDVTVSDIQFKVDD